MFQWSFKWSCVQLEFISSDIKCFIHGILLKIFVNCKHKINDRIIYWSSYHVAMKQGASITSKQNYAGRIGGEGKEKKDRTDVKETDRLERKQRQNEWERYRREEGIEMLASA
jgi:hypothetical protein